MTHRLVQLGCGRWGRNILRDLLSLGAHVTVVDPDASARDHAQAQGAAAFARPEDVPGRVDAYVVAVPTALHADVIDPLLAGGRPIFCEKPLTSSVARARSIAKHCSRRNLFVMEKWRHHPGIQALREIAVSGELGAVRGLHCTRVQWGHLHRDVDAIWTLAPHDLSIADTILGRVPEPRFAAALGAPDRGDGLWAAFGRDPWFVMEVSSLHPQTRREVRLVCDRGVAVLEDALADHLKIVRFRATGSADAERRPTATDMPLRLELRAFLDYLDGGPEPPCGLDAAVASVECIARLRALAGLADAATAAG